MPSFAKARSAIRVQTVQALFAAGLPVAVLETRISTTTAGKIPTGREFETCAATLQKVGDPA